LKVFQEGNNSLLEARKGWCSQHIWLSGPKAWTHQNMI